VLPIAPATRFACPARAPLLHWRRLVARRLSGQARAARPDAARRGRSGRGGGVGPGDAPRARYRDPVSLEVPGRGPALGWSRAGPHRAARLTAVRLRGTPRVGCGGGGARGRLGG